MISRGVRDLAPDAELDVVFFGFEHERREALHLGFQFLRRAVYRGQARDSELAGICSGESGVHVALGVEAGAHGDQVRMDVKHIGDDLRRGGLVPLTLRTGTDGDDDFAIDVELAVGALRVSGKRRAAD